jgi:hypothetical protein
MPITESFPRDANNVPITTDGLISTDPQTLIGNNTTVVVPIFTITGAIEVRGIWGVVTTVIGVNHTASAFRLNDATNQSNITLNTGTDISAANVGSLIVKKGLATAAVTLIKADQERVSEPTTLETPFFSPFVVVAKNGATTNIEYVYATTDAPTTGAIKFSLRWLPLLSTSNVTAL